MFYGLFNVYRSQIDPKAKVHSDVLRCAMLGWAVPLCCLLCSTVVSPAYKRLGMALSLAFPTPPPPPVLPALQFGDALFFFAASIIVANIVR